MEFIKTNIEGVIIVKPDVFGDERGYFYESYSAKKWAEAGLSYTFVQDNESKSKKGVLRGLHFQAPPYAQAKLVRVIKGAVLDVAVDIRKSSPTYGQHVSVELSEENKLQFLMPPGIAHGFSTLREDTIFCYKVDAFYAPQSEMSVKWDDPQLGIDWKITNPLLSPKDHAGLCLKDFKTPFI
ncbi:MAG: dTDP-4-dehydrorhamnose 3,5-epimerase [Bacteroidales bacterium]